MTSAIRRLLDEISWEGNARKYRGGGEGKENVLTAEVFQALDFLPRTAFLGAVLDVAERRGCSATTSLSDSVESMTFDVLPGDLGADGWGVRVQPDVLLSSDDTLVFVEAKAIRRAAFQTEQMARSVLVAQAHAAGRRAVLLLVLGAPPPIAVKGLGRMTPEEAVVSGMAAIAARRPAMINEDTNVEILWITWSEIAQATAASAAAFPARDQSVSGCLRRLADSLVSAVAFHG